MQCKMLVVSSELEERSDMRESRGGEIEVVTLAAHARARFVNKHLDDRLRALPRPVHNQHDSCPWHLVESLSSTSYSIANRCRVQLDSESLPSRATQPAFHMI